ncbi:DUF72 domain-containing protein [Streptodolium elevatio]|uniref:DUF72 domain-containing protein n=1 Tax=Streptodolium elevatio TaxID=3157996 RepID=A0ABV3DIH6_9ACTN
MDRISVGTCSWTDAALITSGWYPPECSTAEARLRYYTKQFDVVEVDATYYSLPSARNSELWVERTPDTFAFDVKVFSLLTGHPTRPRSLPPELRAPMQHWPGRADPRLLDEIWQRFSGALRPLRDAGRLGSVLFQFPPSFAPGPDATQFLVDCVERAGDWPLAVEFRHPAWWSDANADTTQELLRRLDVSAVAVDMTQTLSTSIPPVATVTASRLAVVRFHGRSPAWGTGSKEDRFRHTYSVAELAEWVPRLHGLAESADHVHVLFNNCCADASVRAAEAMDRLLHGDRKSA